MRLSSAAFLEGFYSKPRMDKEILERHSAGLICLSGCVSSEFSELLLAGRTEEAETLAIWYQRVFGPENFYIEIQDNGLSIQRAQKEAAVDLAKRMGIPLVATSDAHYLTREDAKAHDVLLCINTGKTVDDPRRMKFETDEYYVRTAEEMYAALGDQEEALKETERIAERVEPNYESLELGKRQFPSFQPPGGATPEAYLRELCERGLEERYGAEAGPLVRARLEHELGIINRMGFASYFLIVWDFVRFARERGIPSSARGSACGAIVSYLLYLSHVDPIKYDLLFERFLDPNRSEAPDIDIDLCQNRRYEVIEYVKTKYGSGNVAQIGTFGTMKAKAALKDVGRALNIPLARVEQLTKLVPSQLNITLAEALEEEPALRRLAEEDPEVRTLFEHAQRLEGTARNVSTHAAGVVIADRPLMDLVPLQRLSNKEDVITTQWEMGDVEKAGLLKMDFLGLRNLSSLETAVRLIRERHGEGFTLEGIPLDDAATYELLQRGDAKGVFQLEGAGIRDLLVKMKPDRFADLIAILALYRPGPLGGGMVEEYVQCKHGLRQPTYIHPVMKEVLEETYGVMVYQEQVMRILNRLGGIELSQAYACIKAISKKKAEQIAQAREQFMSGAVARGVPEGQAKAIFDLIVHFGGYGFNKSHSTAYALVLYQTAYLKAHYPVEFMAAVLSSEMDGSEREKFLVEHIEDCRRNGIKVEPPDVNASDVGFRPDDGNRIWFGLGAIKGVGTKAVEVLIAERRARGPYRSLDGFFERVSTRDVSASCVETLIRAGAFDSLGARRSQLLAILPRAVQAGQTKQEDLRRGQRGLFDDLDASEEASGGEAATLPLPEVPELTDAERLAGEKKALGFYMTSHPLARHAEMLRAYRTHEVTDLKEVAERTEVILGGMIASVQLRNVQKSRSGLTRMAKLVFEDLSGTVPAMLWPEDYQKNESAVVEDAMVFVRGTLDRRREPAELVINRVIPLERAEAELSRGVLLTLRKGVVELDQLERMMRLVRQQPGGLDVFMEVFGIEGLRRAICRAGPAFKIRHDAGLLNALAEILGNGNVRMMGRGGVTERMILSEGEGANVPEPAGGGDRQEQQGRSGLGSGRMAATARRG
jgi:DNA polymerase-3 subunit alpha